MVNGTFPGVLRREIFAGSDLLFAASQSTANSTIYLVLLEL